MASPTRWSWVWVNSGSWWWTGRPGMLWFTGLQRVGHVWATELNLLQGASQVALMVKTPLADAGDIRDMGSIPGLGRSPGGGHGNPLQYSWLNPMGKGFWWDTAHRVTKSRKWGNLASTHTASYVKDLRQIQQYSCVRNWLVIYWKQATRNPQNQQLDMRSYRDPALGAIPKCVGYMALDFHSSKRGGMFLEETKQYPEQL